MQPLNLPKHIHTHVPTPNHITFLSLPSTSSEFLLDRRRVNRALKGGALVDLAGAAAALGPHVGIARRTVLSCFVFDGWGVRGFATHAQSRPHTPSTHLHQRAQPDGRRLLDESDVIPRQLRLVPREGLGTNVLQRLQPRVVPQADRPLLEESVVDLRLRGAGRDGGREGALGQLGVVAVGVVRCVGGSRQFSFWFL